MPDTDLIVQINQETPIPLDVDLRCSAGEVIALVGPSGSGKSTLLRCIGGLHKPRHGLVHCGGQAWFDSSRRLHLPARKRPVGFVFQHYGLFPHMTAAGNVAAALGHLPRRERPRRAQELLQLVNLAGLENRRPAELSGGQQQRVGVARALARDPAVLLLDEPFSAVDKMTRQKLYRELAALRRQLNIPTVLVTHDMDEAATLADRLCILYHGSALQTAAPMELLARPASALVARLIGLRNVFAGVVLEQLPEQQITVLGWGPHRLSCSWQPQFAVGSRVSWTIPTGKVLLRRQKGREPHPLENTLTGTVTEYLPLGDHVSVGIAVGAAPELRLTMNLPLHSAQRHGVDAGRTINVALLGEAVHLMQAEA